MSTTNTDYSWYWWIRQKETTGYIGICDDEGSAPATANLNIDIWGWAAPTEITTDDDTLPIPPEFELGFLKGCVNELLQMEGSFNSQYHREYEDTLQKARAKAVNEAQQPMQILPLDMRND